MFFRSVSFVAALGAVALLPLACGSFSADDGPAAGGAGEGGAAEGEGGGGGGGGVEGGPAPDGVAPEGSTTSAPFVLATGYKDLRAIAATETDVFWVDQAGNSGVYTAPIIGGNARVLAPGGSPSSVAIVGNYVFWTDPTVRKIGRMDIAGNGPVQWSPQEPGTGFPPSIVVGATGTVVALLGSTASTGEVRQYDVDLGAPALTSTNLTNPFSLAAFDTRVYWTEGGSSSSVVKDIVGTTSPMSLFKENDPESIAADAAGVYWTSPPAKKIRGSINGALPITLASGESEPRSIAADGTYVYWTTSNNELRRAGHVDNGTSSLFASGFTALTEMHVRAIAVTSMYVVWLTADGSVLRLPSH